MPQRAYRFRFYPNATQRGMLARMFGTGRWVWNQCLSWRSDLYRSCEESVTGVDFSRELTFLKTLEPYAWLREVPAMIATQALRDQDRAFRPFFRGYARYPRYKFRRGPQSVRLQALPLAVRALRCPECGADHDRDHNAARNIEREGLRWLEHP